MDEWLEAFWGDLLSEESARILAAWARIDPPSRLAVHAHLQRMATEDGWAAAQRDSATAALRILNLPDELTDADRREH